MKIEGVFLSVAIAVVALSSVANRGKADEIVAADATDQATDQQRYARPSPRRPSYQDRLDEIQKTLSTSDHLNDVSLVFVGDSITELWLMGESHWKPGIFGGAKVWNHLFGSPDKEFYALNLGLSGDRTEHVLHRLADRSEGGLGHFSDPQIQPRFIVLLVGINNTWAPDNPDSESIANGISAVVDRLLTLRPNARLLVSSVLPTNDELRNQEYVRPINQILRCRYPAGPDATGAEYFDLYAHYVDEDGIQVSRHFYDGIHLNESGYEVWANVLLQRIATAE